MRIIGGSFKGRKLQAPTGRELRPTSDRLRERVMNILLHRREGGFAGADIVDLFAGTGAFGLECLSRGAANAAFVDNDRSAVAIIRQNIESLDVGDRAIVFQTDALSLPRRDQPADILFADPPYLAGLAKPALECALSQGWIGADSIVAVEIARGEDLELGEDFTLVDRREQARSAVLIFTINSMRPVQH